MDNTVVHQRYSGRPAAVRTHNRTGRGNKQLSEIITWQLLICIVLFAIIVIVRNIDIPACKAVNKGIEYILTNDTRIDNLTSGAKELVADIRNSIIKADENNSDKIAIGSDQSYTSDQTQVSGQAATEYNKSLSDHEVESIDIQAIADTSENTHIAAGAQGSNETLASGEAQTLSEAQTSSKTQTLSDAETSSKTQTSGKAQTSGTLADNNVSSSNKAAEHSSKAEPANETAMPESSVLSATSDKFAEESGMLLPVEGTLNTLFGTISKSGVIHNGIDIDVDKDSSVRAVLDGVINDAGTSREYGSYVRVKHADGLETVYAHCSSIDAGIGNDVRKGDIIASVGNTGISVKSHLHFEVWKENEPVDPLEYVSVPFN